MLSHTYITPTYSFLKGGECCPLLNMFNVSACLPRQRTNNSPMVGSMLGQRRRQWTSIDPTMGE